MSGLDTYKQWKLSPTISAMKGLAALGLRFLGGPGDAFAPDALSKSNLSLKSPQTAPQGRYGGCHGPATGADEGYRSARLRAVLAEYWWFCTAVVAT